MSEPRVGSGKFDVENKLVRKFALFCNVGFWGNWCQFLILTLMDVGVGPKGTYFFSKAYKSRVDGGKNFKKSIFLAKFKTHYLPI